MLGDGRPRGGPPQGGRARPDRCIRSARDFAAGPPVARIASSHRAGRARPPQPAQRLHAADRRTGQRIARDARGSFRALGYAGRARPEGDGMNRMVLGALIALVLVGVGVFWWLCQAWIEAQAPPSPAALAKVRSAALPHADGSG